jgi:endonuclease/exonuclease/phosphatase family metal-dependent hydrolase
MVRTLAGRERRLVPARTFPAALPWFRLDRIYVRGFKVEHAEVCTGRSGRAVGPRADRRQSAAG